MKCCRLKSQKLQYYKRKAVNLLSVFLNDHNPYMQDDRAWKHHRTCVPNILFALREPHAVLCLGGCMHDRAYTLSTTSTPCAYLHTQSCLVSLRLKTSSSLFEIHRLSCPFSQPHVGAISVDSTFPCPPHSDREEEILGSLVYDVILWQAKVRYVSWSHIQQTVLVHM